MKRSLLLKILFISLPLLFAVYVMGLLFIQSKLPSVIESRVNSDGVTVDIRKASLSLFKPFHITFLGVEFDIVRRGQVNIRGDIQRVSINVDLFALLNEQIQIDLLNVFNARVDYIEPKTSTSKKKQASTWPSFLVSNISLKESRFNYVQKEKGQQAQISIKNIEIDIDKVSTLKKDKNFQSHFKGTATIAGGKVEVSSSFYLNQSPLVIETRAQMQDHELKKISPFLAVGYGFSLRGKILKGEAQSHYEGGNIRSQVKATYKDLALDLHDTSERSLLMTWIKQIGVEFALCESNIKKPQSEKKATAKTQHQSQSIISSLLEGLLAASLKLACLD